jgi:tripartite-type tricarboxylate transporter receptor subunit TctC
VSLITKVPQVLSSIRRYTPRTSSSLSTSPKIQQQIELWLGGSGTTGHLIAELLKKRAAIPMTHVPLQRLWSALAATLSGEVEIMLSGRLR